MQRFSARSLLLVTAAAFTLACGDNPSGPDGADPASLLITTGGSTQRLAAGGQVPITPTVRVLDTEGQPVAGVTVSFQVASGGGTVSGATPTTNAAGDASVGSWTLGPGAGANSLTAAVEGVDPVTFNATAQIPANVTLYVGAGQTAQVGTPLPVSPTILVTDVGGDPIHVATVTFSVEGGGGSATEPIQTTDAQGFARVPAWRLGADPGLNTLRAVVAGFPPIDVTATGQALDPGAFNIALRFVSVVSPDQYAVFEQARTRWEEVITGDLGNLSVANQVLCTGAPNATETIDDVVIFVNLVDIDGPGNVLASAGPCAIRTSNGLPIAGVMNFDTGDLGASPELFRDVILHEMGHVVGIGSLWNVDSPARTLVTGVAGDDPFFTGTGAIAAFDLAGGNVYAGNKVPVEHNGGAGTRDSHWREGAPRFPEEGLRSELMTGYVSVGGSNPLSAITIASLADMGYSVDMTKADDYSWTAGTSTLRLYAGEDATPLNEAPLTSPILVFDDGGRIERSVERR